MGWVAEILDTMYNQPSWYVGSAVTSCYLLYYLFEVVKRPIIVTSPKGRFSLFTEKHLPILKEKYWPTIWCIESRIHTILATVVRISILPKVPYKREILRLKDGGEVGLDILSPDENPRTPTLITLPGLTGGSESDYVKNLALVAKDLGFRVVVFNQRGLGGIPLKTPRTYCAANYEDFMEVIDYVRKKYEEATLAAVGISMGGMILGHYLSSPEGSKTPLSCAMMISVPWDAQLGVRNLETPINLVFNWHLARCLCGIVRRIRPVLEGKVTFLNSEGFDNCLKSKTIREFDSNFTIKEFGYKDIDDYYESASLHKKIHKVKIPVLSLNAADDPFQPIEGIPMEVANKMDNLCIVVTSRGGHIGFMEGFCPINQDQYMFRLCGEYFQAMILDGGLSLFS